MSTTNYERIPSYGQHGLGATLVYSMMILFLLLTTYYFYFAIEFNAASLIPSENSDWQGFSQAILPNWESALVYLLWFGLHVLLYYFAPGKKDQGIELEKGGRLTYPINGNSAMWISLSAVGLIHFSDFYTLDRLYHNFGALITTITLFSLAKSLWLYFYGKRTEPRHLSGNFMRDFWMGTVLNPRWPDTKTGFDFKYFCEGRPGLIGWMVLNFAMLDAQYKAYGFVSLAMIIVVLMQLFYIAHYFHNERFILTTMDIKHENFGLMLTYGDLVWVPFLYCLQAYYLIHHVHDLPLWVATLIVLFNAASFYLFKVANDQKDEFRRDPDKATIWGEKARYMETKTGSKLLLSGFWGKARHLNYTGDWMMALAWSLPCLFGSVVPYFYPIYFAILLIHRDIRDNEICKEKYGEDWDRYCEKVPWRLIPGVY